MVAFPNLSRTEVDAALADTDPANPIAVEVARLLTLYSQNFAEHCERIGRVPTELLLAKPDTAIERVAMELCNQTLADSLGEPVKIIWTSVA